MRPLRVLILEDSRPSQVGLAALLAREPSRRIAPVVAETVDQALAWFDDPANAPEVVILDLRLPGRPGEDLIRELDARGFDPRIVVTTGETDSRRLAAVQALHPHVILIKPYDRDELLAAIGLGDFPEEAKP